MSEISKKYNIKQNFIKYRKYVGIGSLGVFITFLVLSYASTPTEDQVKEKNEESSTFSTTGKLNLSQSDILIQKELANKQDQQSVNLQILARLATLESENTSYKNATLEAESNAQALNDKLLTLTTSSKLAASASASQNNRRAIFVDSIDDSSDGDSFESAARAAVKPDQDKAVNADKRVISYIPSNSFVEGTLISALSANTGGNASAEPTPVLIRLTNMAKLPNEFKSNLRSCMVGGSGWGDLSTERVKIRLTNLSCVLKSTGQSIDIPVDGYISGEDSKAGIRGLVVTHAGSLAAQATLAGFVQGVGQIGQAVGQTQTITPLGGVTTTISPSQAVTSGVGSGISQAGNNLSQYYMQMLTQISPSIEVSAGRHITVIFTKGVELKLPINSQDTNSSDNGQLPFNK